jgi:glycosyltransferase involved in cell wall biosynthesis
VDLLGRASFDDFSILVVETTLRSSGSISRLIMALRMVVRVIGSLLKYRPSAVLCFAGAFGSFWEKTFWADLGRLFGARIGVVMVDGNFPRFEKSLKGWRRRMLGRRLRRFQLVGVQSHGWLDYYRGICPEGAYATVIGGVDSDIFSPTNKSPTATPLIIYVGWMIEEKGIYELIAAAGKLSAQGEKFRIKLIGPVFDQGPRLQKAIADQELDSTLEIVGTVAHRDALIEEYQAADLFVLPSYAEGFPNAILEAMSVGLPVVATNVGGVPEIVDDGVTGIIVPVRDSDALSAAIGRLLRHEPERQAMGAAARRKILTNYTIDHVIASYQQMFQALTAQTTADDQPTAGPISKEKCVE